MWMHLKIREGNNDEGRRVAELMKMRVIGTQKKRNGGNEHLILIFFIHESALTPTF